MAAHQAPPSLGFSRQKHWSGLPFPFPVYESEKWKWSCSVVSDPQRPHGLWPSRRLCPWDFPGKSTGVGCHCLLWLNVLRWPKCEVHPKKRGYMYMFSCFTLLYSRNWHTIVKQLYSNKNKLTNKNFKKIRRQRLKRQGRIGSWWQSRRTCAHFFLQEHQNCN